MRSTLQITREAPKTILKKFSELAARDSKIRYGSLEENREKAKISRERAALYARHIEPTMDDYLDMPLEASEDGDSLGTLAGTLVAQKVLELFRYEFPMLSRIYTDFSAEPGLFNQPLKTRIVVTPAVETYDNTLGADNRPLGWNVVTPAQTIDVPITMDEHVGIPIVFGADTLSSTARKLFDEISPAAAYALSKYFVEKIYALITPANFNAYAAIVPVKVPVAYATYQKAEIDFGRRALVNIGAILTQNEVPQNNRSVLLNPSYYADLASDASLVTFFAGQQAPEIITDSTLPKLAKFLPVEVPNLPAANNITGFAMHRAALVAKTALPAKLNDIFQGAGLGTETVITDSQLGISMLLTQYVNHDGGYAAYRLSILLGAAVGDKRGGLCITD